MSNTYEIAQALLDISPKEWYFVVDGVRLKAEIMEIGLKRTQTLVVSSVTDKGAWKRHLFQFHPKKGLTRIIAANSEGIVTKGKDHKVPCQ